MYADQLARMTQAATWAAAHAHLHQIAGTPPCSAASAAQTVIPGTRTITHQPLGAPGERERGTIDNEAFKDSDWLGDNPQQVIELMDDYLGTIPEGEYNIVE